MQSIPKSRIALAQRWTQIATNDYSAFTPDELIREAADLHATLADCGRFGRAAELGLRRLIVDTLLVIDAEHQRRRSPVPPASAFPAPRLIRSAPATDRPAAA